MSGQVILSSLAAGAVFFVVAGWVIACGWMLVASDSWRTRSPRSATPPLWVKLSLYFGLHMTAIGVPVVALATLLLQRQGLAALPAGLVAGGTFVLAVLLLFRFAWVRWGRLAEAIVSPPAVVGDARSTHRARNALLLRRGLPNRNENPIRPTLAQTDPIEQLPRTESLAGRLLRLPLFSDLADADQERVIAALMEVVTLL
jgi:hypothetical protein